MKSEYYFLQNLTRLKRWSAPSHFVLSGHTSLGNHFRDKHRSKLQQTPCSFEIATDTMQFRCT